MVHGSGRYWPTDAETDLLRACLLAGDAAIGAWTRWRARVDSDRLDAGSERLLPLLAHNLKQQGVADPHLGRYAGIVEYTWVANQRRLASVMPVIRACHRAGIPTMFLKGMALALHCYRHAGLRPMDDVDVLVPAGDARRAMALLEESGWIGGGGGSADIDPAMVHSRPFRRGREEMDLHWYALCEMAGSESGDAVWPRASETMVGGTPMRVMAPDDLFLQTVIHGAKWQTVKPLRWIADAMTILQVAGSAFDWHRLLDTAIRERLVLPIREAAALLAERFDAAIPAATLDALTRHVPSAFERVEHRMRALTSPRVGGLPLVLCYYVRVTQGGGRGAMLRSVPRYLRSVYGLPARGPLPVVLGQRAARRLYRALRPKPG